MTPKRQVESDRGVCRAPDCTCARHPDPTCAEVLRLRAENERLRRRLLGIDRACAEFQGRGKIVPAAIYDAVRASQTPAASDETEAHRG